MRKITSVGIKPASSIAEVLTRKEVSVMSSQELEAYLGMLGFPEDEVKKALTAFYNRSN